MLSFFKREKKMELPLYNSDIPEAEKGFIDYFYELKEIIIGK